MDHHHTTRRAFLKALPVAALALPLTFNAYAVEMPTTDPVLVARAKVRKIHRLFSQRYDAFEAARVMAHAAGTPRPSSRIVDRLRKELWRSEMAMARTVPTTLAGTIMLAAYLAKEMEGCDDPWHVPAARSIAKALRRGVA